MAPAESHTNAATPKADTSSVTIRHVTDPSEAPTLAELGRTTFDQTFRGWSWTDADGTQRSNKDEDMDTYNTEAFSVATQRKLIESSQHHIFIATVKSADGTQQDVGYCMLNQASTEECLTIPHPRVEIQRMYVIKQWQGQGVAKLLWDHAFQYAVSTLQCKGIWLGVWQENKKAQAFYRKQGFKQCGHHIFQFGNDPQKDEIWQSVIQQNVQ